MSDAPVEPAAQQPAPALPRSQVLSYVASAESPTRVRQIAARALVVIGILHAVAAMSVLAAILWLVKVQLDLYTSVPPAWHPTSTEEFHSILEDNSGFIVLFFCAVTVAAILLACAYPVGRGRKAACYFSLVCLVPLALCMLMVSVALAGFAIFMGFGFEDLEARPAFFLLLFPFAIAIVLILLLWDLAGYIWWIARNPITEKPPVPFLPNRSGSTEPGPK